MYRLSNLFMLCMGHKAVRVLLRQESWATYAWWLPHHRIKSFIFLLVKLFSFVHPSIYLPLLSHSFLSFFIMPFMGMDVKEHIQFEFKWSNLVMTNTSKHSYIKKNFFKKQIWRTMFSLFPKTVLQEQTYFNTSSYTNLISEKKI